MTSAISSKYLQFLNNNCTKPYLIESVNGKCNCCRTCSRRSKHIAMCTHRSRGPGAVCSDRCHLKKMRSCFREDWMKWTKDGIIWRRRVWLSGQCYFFFFFFWIMFSIKIFILQIIKRFEYSSRIVWPCSWVVKA